MHCTQRFAPSARLHGAWKSFRRTVSHAAQFMLQEIYFPPGTISTGARELLSHSFAARILPEHSSHRCTSHSSDETWQLSNRHLVRIYPSLLGLATNSRQMHISTREIHFLPISHARLRIHGSTCVFQTEKQFYGNRALFSFLGDAHSDALSTRNDGDGRKSFSLSPSLPPLRERFLFSRQMKTFFEDRGAQRK